VASLGSNSLLKIIKIDWTGS